MIKRSFSPWPSFTQEEADAVHRVVLSNRVRIIGQVPSVAILSLSSQPLQARAMPSHWPMERSRWMWRSGRCA